MFEPPMNKEKCQKWMMLKGEMSKIDDVVTNFVSNKVRNNIINF